MFLSPPPPSLTSPLRFSFSQSYSPFSVRTCCRFVQFILFLKMDYVCLCECPPSSYTSHFHLTIMCCISQEMVLGGSDLLACLVTGVSAERDTPGGSSVRGDTAEGVRQRRMGVLLLPRRASPPLIRFFACILHGACGNYRLACWK